ncbi:hypothetical protein X801_05705 [Opisthorchis viverrini]|uniref:Peptidase A1 domain-containing protein n=1 Tax=Opisthorchis viverrini TaxID=6198 RepID=A0A1S8WVH3_OPIVI|nr:hypothetical protein X801_05705 [Opisthorchis viverrini]
MTVLFDSGSCHTWIRSVNSGTVFTSVPYDFRESSTYEPLAKTFSETYAACRISGRYMKEAITVAQFYCVHFTTQPVQIGEVMVQGVILAEAFEQSGACSQTRPFDGIFGLCLSSKTPETEPTIFEQLYKHGTFDTAVFSIWFKPPTNHQYQGQASMIFGVVRRSGLTGEAVSFKMQSKTYLWTFNIGGVRSQFGRAVFNTEI